MNRNDREQGDVLTSSEKEELAEELLASDAWRLFFRPYLEQKATAAAAQAISRALSPEKRTEFVEAANLLPEIIQYPDTILKAADRRLKKRQ